MSAPRSWRTFGSVNSSRRARSGSRLLPGISIYGKQISQAREGANKQVISSQADSLIKISRIWADFFPANTSN